MSLNLSAPIARAKNKIYDDGAWLILLELNIPGLDEPLKLVRNTEDINWPEEKQDFEDDYTEVDPGADITVDGNDITFAGLPNNVDAYVCKDFASKYFSGDFEHRIDGVKYISESGLNTLYTFIWALSNEIDDWKGLDDGNKDSLGVCLYKLGGSSERKIILFENDGGTTYTDSYNISVGTTYYLTVKRDESIGMFGTLYCLIYSDEARTELLDTLTLTLHTSKKDYRYLFGILSYNAANASSMTGEVKSIEIYNRWIAFPFDIDEAKQDSSGSIQTLTALVSNARRQVEKYINQADGGAGSTVIVRVIYTGEPTEEAVIEETFNVGSIPCDDDWVRIELTPDSFFTQRFPRYLFSRTDCKKIFKGRECGYTGTAYSTCNHVLADCILRFQELGLNPRFGGTPSIPDGEFDKVGIIPSYAE